MAIGSMISTPRFGYRSLVGERDAAQFNTDEPLPVLGRPDTAHGAQRMYNDLVERFATESAYTANGICGTLSVWDLIPITNTEALRVKMDLVRQIRQTRCAINVLSHSDDGAARAAAIRTEISEMHYGGIILDDIDGIEPI